jgi:hypothetical protein
MILERAARQRRLTSRMILERIASRYRLTGSMILERIARQRGLNSHVILERIAVVRLPCHRAEHWNGWEPPPSGGQRWPKSDHQFVERAMAQCAREAGEGGPVTVFLSFLKVPLIRRLRWVRSHIEQSVRFSQTVDACQQIRCEDGRDSLGSPWVPRPLPTGRRAVMERGSETTRGHIRHESAASWGRSVAARWRDRRGRAASERLALYHTTGFLMQQSSSSGSSCRVSRRSHGNTEIEPKSHSISSHPDIEGVVQRSPFPTRHTAFTRATNSGYVVGIHGSPASPKSYVSKSGRQSCPEEV